MSHPARMLEREGGSAAVHQNSPIPECCALLTAEPFLQNLMKISKQKKPWSQAWCLAPKAPLLGEVGAGGNRISIITDFSLLVKWLCGYRAQDAPVISTHSGRCRFQAWSCQEASRLGLNRCSVGQISRVIGQTPP